MATRFSIMPSIDGDRTYFAEDFLARPFSDLSKQGVYGGFFDIGPNEGWPGGMMKVIPNDPEDLSVLVTPGAANVNGYRFEVFSSPEQVALPQEDCAIVVRLDLSESARNITLDTKTVSDFVFGTPIINLTRNEQVYEIALAFVQIESEQTSVSESDIEDMRSHKVACGLASDLTIFHREAVFNRNTNGVVSFYTPLQNSVNIDGEENQEVYGQNFSELYDFFRPITGGTNTDPVVVHGYARKFSGDDGTIHATRHRVGVGSDTDKTIERSLEIVDWTTGDTSDAGDYVLGPSPILSANWFSDVGSIVNVSFEINE